MLDVEAITVTIEDTEILSSTTLSVADGEVVAVLGPSGSGKSTLLRAIAGLVPLSSGDVLWDGQSLREIPTHQRRFGLMFQGYALFPHMSVGENVGFGLRMTKTEGPGEQVEEALGSVGLGGWGDRSIDSLSGGEGQRVALARTLAPHPRLVMLDEPLGALDRNLRKRLVAETRQLLVERGVTSIVVTHDRDEAVALSDRLALMRAGRIIQTGTLEQLLTSPFDKWVTDFLS
ncbi:MAG: ABC transporter ATP-binding protein [Acidimicrobiia bacterium]